MATDTHVGVGIAISIVTAGACTSCIAAGTPVATPSGPIAIEELNVGQSVWAWSIAERRRVVREITAVHGGRGDEQLLWSLKTDAVSESPEAIPCGVRIEVVGVLPVRCRPEMRSGPSMHPVGDVRSE